MSTEKTNHNAQFRQEIRRIVTADFTTTEAVTALTALLESEIARRQGNKVPVPKMAHEWDDNVVREHKQMVTVAKVSAAFAKATK